MSFHFINSDLMQPQAARLQALPPAALRAAPLDNPYPFDFITPQVVIGSRRDAENDDALIHHRIDAVLSFAPIERPMPVARQLSLHLQDRVALPAEVIEEAVAFLREQVSRGRRVLVHCEMGMSRSPAIVACYLHEEHGLDIDAALRQIRAVRPAADPHPALVASMRDYYAAGADCLDLSGNENPLGPSPCAVAAIHREARRQHRYPDRDGSVLRARLAQDLGVPAGQVLLGNGASEIIELATRATLGAGDEVLLPDPVFPSYLSAARRAGARVVPVPLVLGQYDVEQYLSRITPATRLVVVITPHNPTGSVMGRAAMQRLLAALPAQARLLVDEAYCDFSAEEGADLLPHLDSCGRELLVLHSLSKAQGLAGLRLGYAAATRQFAQDIERLRQPYNTNALAQAAALAALDDSEHHARTMENNRAGRDQLQQGLAGLGLEYTPSQANFVLFHAGHGMVDKLAERGVLVKCMARYGLPGWARVTVGRPAENSRFLDTLAELCQAGVARGQLAYG